MVFTRPYEHLIIGTCALEIATGKYFYFTPVMDGFSRAILNFSVGLSYHDDVFIATLNQTLTVLKSPVILHLTHKDAAKSYKLHDYIAKSPIYTAVPKKLFKAKHPFWTYPHSVEGIGG